MQPTKRRVLCAEPHADTCEMLGTILELSNYEVESAGTLTEALSRARSEHFDLYLLDDWYMDGTSVELCQRIREFDPQTPILFYSSLAFEPDRRRAMEAGAQAFLIKPGGIDQLVEIVSRLLAELTNTLPPLEPSANQDTLDSEEA